MSHGAGRVMQVIEAAFAAEPDMAFSTEELCRLTGSQPRAVLRAVKKRPDTASMASKHRGGALVFYNADSVDGHARAYLIANFADYDKAADTDPLPSWRFCALTTGFSRWSVEIYRARRDGRSTITNVQNGSHIDPVTRLPVLAKLTVEFVEEMLPHWEKDFWRREKLHSTGEPQENDDGEPDEFDEITTSLTGHRFGDFPTPRK